MVDEGNALGVELLQRAASVPHLSTDAPPADPDERLPGTVYLQDLFPTEKDTERSGVIRDTLSAAGSSPADLEALSQEYQRAMEGGHNTTARANQLMHEQSVARSVRQIDTRTDPIFASTAPVLDLQSDVYDAWFGDCQTTTIEQPIYQSARLSEGHSCNRVFVGEDMSCSVERALSFTTLERRVVLRLSATDATGESVPFSGAFEPFGAETIGSGRIETFERDGLTYRLDILPFEVDVATHFTHEHALIMDGGNGLILSYGREADGQRTVAMVQADQTSLIEIEATLVRIDANAISGCELYFDTVADGFCDGSLSCTHPVGACTTIDGISFCDGGGPAAGLAERLTPYRSSAAGDMPPLASPLCMAATSTPLECGFFIGGSDSWVGADGQVHQFFGTGAGLESNLGPAGFLDDCRALSNNASCDRVADGPCVAGAEGPVTGRCYVADTRFECGATVQWTDVGTRQVTTECGGPIRCMGHECKRLEQAPSEGFRAAAAKVQLIQHASHDAHCLEHLDDDPGNDPSTPEQCTLMLLTGTDHRCRHPIGPDQAFPNCCEKGLEAASDVGYAEYLKLAQGAYLTHAHPEAASEAAQDERLGSAIDTAAGDDRYVSAPYRSSLETIAGAFGHHIDEAGEAETFRHDARTPNGAAVRDEMAQGMREWMSGRGLSGGAQALFGTGTQPGISGAPATAAQWMGAVAGEYAAARLDALNPSNPLFQCDVEEAELGFRRQTRACTYVGRYCSDEIDLGVTKLCVMTKETHCCFSSPLSRIVVEQVKDQLGMDFGTAEAPNCAGLTPQQMQSVDFSSLDLSEWEAMTAEAELLPGAEDLNARYAADEITPKALIPGEVVRVGPGHALNVQARTEALLLAGPAPQTADIAQRAAGLYRADTERHANDLMPWFGPTVATDEPAEPIGLSFGVDLGGVTGCAAIEAPPFEPFSGFINPFWPVAGAPQAGSSNGTNHIHVPQGHYLSVPFTPSAVELSAPFNIRVLSEFSSDFGATPFTVSISRCPGDLLPDADTGACRAQANINVSLTIDGPGICGIGTDQTHYVNVVHAQGEALEHLTCMRAEGCWIWIGAEY